jgi:hypothetical protein
VKSWNSWLVACVLACLAYVPSDERLPAQVPSGWVVSRQRPDSVFGRKQWCLSSWLRYAMALPSDGSDERVCVLRRGRAVHA